MVARTRTRVCPVLDSRPSARLRQWLPARLTSAKGFGEAGKKRLLTKSCDLPEESGAGGFPPVGRVGFGKQPEPGQRGLPVAIADGDASAAATADAAQHVPREAGGTEEVVAFPGFGRQD